MCFCIRKCPVRQKADDERLNDNKSSLKSTVENKRYCLCLTGPVMDAERLDSFICALHYKVGSIEKWEFMVTDSVSDHAGHIDETRSCETRSFSLGSDEINISARQPPLQSQTRDR